MTDDTKQSADEAAIVLKAKERFEELWPDQKERGPNMYLERRGWWLKGYLQHVREASTPKPVTVEAVEFDEAAASEFGKSIACRYARNIHTDSEIVEIQVNSTIDGARWQHAKSASALAALTAERDELKKTRMIGAVCAECGHDWCDQVVIDEWHKVESERDKLTTERDELRGQVERLREGLDNIMWFVNQHTAEEREDFTEQYITAIDNARDTLASIQQNRREGQSE